MRLWPFQTKRSTVAAMGIWSPGVPLSAPRNLRALALEGFTRNPLVYACVAFKAFSASDIHLKAQQLVGGDWVDADDTSTRTPEADELQALLDNPNPRQDQTEWLSDTIAQQQTTGNAFAQIELSGAGRPVAVYTLAQPERMQITPDDVKGIAGYVYQSIRGAIDLAAEEVIHFRELPDPLNPLLGLAPAVPVAREIDADNAATDFLKQFFDKGGVPAWALLTKMQVSDPDIKKLKGKWQSEFSLGQGGNAAGGLAVLNGSELTLQKIGSTTGSREMGLTEIRQVCEARICGSFRVHPQVAYTMLGFLHPTYAQARVAQESSWTEGLKPMYTRYAGKLTVAFRAYYPKCRVVCDYSNVPALAEDQDALWKRHQTAYDSGAEAFEEFRDAVKLPADPQGVHFIPYNRQMWRYGEPVAPRETVTETAATTPAEVQAERDTDVSVDPDANQPAPHARAGAGKRLADLRFKVAGEAEPRLAAYFAELAERVTHRLGAQDAKTAWLLLETKGSYPFDADDLVPKAEQALLGAILTPLWLAAAAQGWQATAGEFELPQPFAADDPAVLRLLRTGTTKRLGGVLGGVRDAVAQQLAAGATERTPLAALATDLRTAIETRCAALPALLARAEVAWAAAQGAAAVKAAPGAALLASCPPGIAPGVWAKAVRDELAVSS